jgi:biofilm PGA synthesis N-glycosyltransferase PgaC
MSTPNYQNETAGRERAPALKCDNSVPSGIAAIKYVIVSPVRDEEEYVQRTIDCVLSQTIRPAEWVIVDDGSGDGTARIIDQYAEKYSWIRIIHRVDRGERIPGTGVMEAFYDGYNRLQCQDWEFIVKLDGDVGLDPDYFQRCFEHLCNDPALGMCGGTMYCPRDGQLSIESNPQFHVRGPIKLYRRACWNAIGGLLKTTGWDSLDEFQANRLGWRTKSFSEIKVIHYRPTGAVQGAWRDGIKMGRASYIAGYHPVFMAAKCIKRLVQTPFIVVAIAHAYGFLSGYLQRIPQVQDRELIRYVRKQQIRRLCFLDSIWK